jgi:hypothetical protein
MGKCNCKKLMDLYWWGSWGYLFGSLGMAFALIIINVRHCSDFFTLQVFIGSLHGLCHHGMRP